MTVVATKQAPDAITEQERALAELNMRKAKVQLAIQQPFFATMLMKSRATLDDSIPTACVNMQGHIRVGTRFAATITVQQMMFVLAHEVMHPALLHFTRMGTRKPRPWNVAGDKVINDILVSAGLTKVDDCIYVQGASQHTTEDLYDENDDGGGGSGAYQPGSGLDDLYDENDDGGGGSGAYQPGSGLDDLDQSYVGEAEARGVEENWRVTVAQARTVAKQQGKMPAALDKLVDKIVNPVTPWFLLLERFMTNFIKADYSWRRPNKRHIGAGMYLPSHDLLPTMGTVVIQSDESGSIGDKERNHFAGHINKILETCRPEKVIVLHTDTRVHKHVDEYTLDDLPIQFKTYCCGGTDMRAGIEWCKKNGVDPEVFITLTDGYTPFPDKDPGFPVVWLITTDVVAPMGETIAYQMD